MPPPPGVLLCPAAPCQHLQARAEGRQGAQSSLCVALRRGCCCKALLQERWRARICVLRTLCRYIICAQHFPAGCWPPSMSQPNTSQTNVAARTIYGAPYDASANYTPSPSTHLLPQPRPQSLRLTAAIVAHVLLHLGRTLECSPLQCCTFPAHDNSRQQRAGAETCKAHWLEPV